MIGEMGIPVLGREEDAADALADESSPSRCRMPSRIRGGQCRKGLVPGDQRDRKEGIPARITTNTAWICSGLQYRLPDGGGQPINSRLLPMR